jgi:peptide/nickel transport system permease protein
MNEPREAGQPGPERGGEVDRRPVIDLFLPGLSAILAGRAAGIFVLGAWLSLILLSWMRRDRIIAAIADPGGDTAVALLTLIALLIVTWLAGRPGAGRRLRRLRNQPGATLGIALLLLLISAALLAPLIAPFDPDVIDLGAARMTPPSFAHWLGTDQLGRDLLSRTLYGARVSLLIGFLAVAIAVTIGTAVGAAAGYFGGWLDALLMRLVDLFLSFPRLVLLVTVVALFEPSIPLIVLVLGLTGWMGVSRLVRGQVLSIREREFVQAARALGYGPGRILGRHVLPNVTTPIIVAATLGIGNAILAEATLSFLGLGVQPPTASWGTIIQAGGDRLIDAWWIATFPGLAIVLTVMSFNLVGDGLRDALDPRRTR